MAIRIHVTAVRDCPAAEVRAAMSDAIVVDRGDQPCPPVGDQLQFTEHGGWTSFSTSVWGVSGGDLNRGLCRLARPAVQFTTSDGDRWYLTVHGGPRGPVEFVHEFSYHSHEPDPDEDEARMEEFADFDRPARVDPRLAFLEEDRSRKRAKPKSAFDYIADSLNEQGAGVPDALRAELADLPFSAAVERYRHWHAERVATVLAEARIPFDPAALKAVLLWKSVRDLERDSDLGNLPRLLSVLGLGGDWDNFVAQAEGRKPVASEEDETEDQDDEPPPPIDHFGPVVRLTERLELAAVAGGPVPLPLDDLGLIPFFVEALAINDTAGVVLNVTLPPKRKALAKLPRNNDGSAELTPDGFRVAFNNHLWFNAVGLGQKLGKPLARQLGSLPDGTTIDLAFAHAERPELVQRYRGVVAAKTWQIAATHPRLAREALTSGIELARLVTSDPDRHLLRDEDEARAVVALAARDPNLRGLEIERKGKVVRCKLDMGGHLAKVIFRHRFAGHWDTAGFDREVEQREVLRAKRESEMRRAAVEAERRRAIPHDDAPLHRGKLGACWRTDIARLHDLAPEPRVRIEAALAGLGYRHLGDLVSKKQREILIRAFLSGDGLSYALFMAKRTMYLGYEFFSRFDDGSMLTTTTNGAVDSQPELKVYVKVHSGLEPAALHEKHVWGVGRFLAKKQTKPVPLPATLEGVAREYDRALALREGLGQQFRVVATPPGEAPETIRAAWIGCVMPLFATTDDERVGQRAKGVVSRKREKRPEGFTVRVTDAITALEEHAPDAARWWRENTPQLLEPGKLFVFDGKVCEVVEDDD